MGSFKRQDSDVAYAGTGEAGRRLRRPVRGVCATHVELVAASGRLSREIQEAEVGIWLEFEAALSRCRYVGVRMYIQNPGCMTSLFPMPALYLLLVF